MKMVKKVLMGLAAAAAVMALAGCVIDEEGVNWNTYTKDKQNKIAYYAQIAANSSLNGSWYVPGTTFFEADDTEGAITGSNQNYTVSYANESTDPYRAYKETALKHAGAIIKVTFDSKDNLDTSKMGVIWDLKYDDENEGAKEFYILGLNPVSGKNNFYVSKYNNVTDIQANNFGTDSGAKEKEIVPITMESKISDVEADDDGKYNFFVYYKLVSDGSFDYAVLAGLTDDDLKNFNTNTKFNNANIDGYNVLVKGNTKAVAGAEYEAAEIKE